MDITFFQKQPKPSLFSKKTVFRYKTSERKLKKEPPKRTFRARKSTWWAIFCSTFIFPLLLKVVRAVNQTAQVAGQYAPPQVVADQTGAAAGGVAAGVGVVGAAAVGSIGLIALLGAPVTVSGSVVALGTTSMGFLAPVITFLLGIGPIGWAIIIIAIIVIALLIGFLACDNCEMCESCSEEEPPTPQDTTAVQQGVSHQANMAGSSGIPITAMNPAPAG